MANVTTAYTATGNVCNIILNKFTINNTLSLDTTNCDYPLATHWYAPRPLVTHAAQKSAMLAFQLMRYDESMSLDRSTILCGVL